jgi:hypothetical protein
LPYVKLVGHENPQNETSEISLGDKTVAMGVPVDLGADEQQKLEERGFRFEDSSEQEAQQSVSDTVPTEGQVAGDDVQGAAPSLGPGIDQTQTQTQ